MIDVKLRALEQGVAALGVREIIESFDVKFDIPLKHELCLGLLQLKERDFELRSASDDDPLRLASFVGAHWCRIIAHDVQYRLWDSLESVRASRNQAERLSQRISTPPDTDAQFIAYALARWFDGAGKSYYRVGRYSEGRNLFERAVRVAEHDGLWWALPDLYSNRLRATAEAAIKGGRPPQSILEDFENCGHSIADEAGRHGLSAYLDESVPADLDPRSKEFLRGCSSVLHNYSWALNREGGSVDESLRLSVRSERICRALGDDYRLSQAVLHQILVEQARKDFEGALKRVDAELKTMRWKRGRRILAQQRAKLVGMVRSDGLEAAHENFEALFAEIADARQQPGGEFGLDADFEFFTVNAFRDMFAGRALLRGAQALRPDAKNPYAIESTRDFQLTLANLGIAEPERKKLADTLKSQELGAIRSQRKVVTVSQYKAAFSRLVRPKYLDRIAELAESEQPRHLELISLVEECSAREILDLLKTTSQSTRRVLKSVEDLRGKYFVPVERQQVQAALGPKGHRSARRSTLNENAPGLDPIGEERVREFAHWAEEHPLEVAEHDDEIGLALARLTANFPDICVVRFFGYGREVQSGSRKVPRLGALVYRSQRVVLVTEDKHPRFSMLALNQLQRDAESRRLEGNRELAAEDRIPGDVPDEILCRELWKCIVEPVLPHVLDSGAWPEMLTLIPTDSLFSVPLHVAFSAEFGDRPLCALVPMCYSVSVTAYVSRGRWTLSRQFVENTDDLCAVVLPDQKNYDAVSGQEIGGLPWPAEHLWLAGKIPDNVGAVQRYLAQSGRITRDDLEILSRLCPEFFVYAGHGDQFDEDIGPYLMLDEEERLYWYDIVRRLRLPHNKLAILSACVSGAGANSGGGEVSGFVRAFIAAGAGALGVTLWSVRDDCIASASRALLRAALAAQAQHTPFSCVEELHRFYRNQVFDVNEQERIERCALALYL
jgi:tetratricopeptide (TPR) repeat protein